MVNYILFSSRMLIFQHVTFCLFSHYSEAKVLEATKYTIFVCVLLPLILNFVKLVMFAFSGSFQVSFDIYTVLCLCQCFHHSSVQ